VRESLTRDIRRAGWEVALLLDVARRAPTSSIGPSSGHSGRARRPGARERADRPAFNFLAESGRPIRRVLMSEEGRMCLDGFVRANLPCRPSSLWDTGTNSLGAHADLPDTGLELPAARGQQVDVPRSTSALFADPSLARRAEPLASRSVKSKPSRPVLPWRDDLEMIGLSRPRVGVPVA